MKNKNIKNSFELYSSNPEIKSIVENIKSETKVYSKIITALYLLGNFSKKTNVELYEIIDENNERKIKLCCTDTANNIYIFYALSSNKKDLLKITQLTNDEEIEYDLSLIKNFELNKQNIKFTKTKKELDFKFGRLITDDNSFYNLFLSRNIGYQIEGDFDLNITSELLENLNKITSTPKLSEYINIIENILNNHNKEISYMTISVYKDFLLIDHIEINKNMPEYKNLKIKKQH